MFEPFLSQGYVVLDGHHSLARDAIAVAQSFFDLNLETRMTCHVSRSKMTPRGFAMGESEYTEAVRSLPELATATDIEWAPGQSARGYSSFDVGRADTEASDPLDSFLFADNLYPTSDVRTAVEAIYREFELVAQAVLRFLGETFGMRLEEASTSYSSMRLLHYSAGAEGWSKAHTDFELFALIAASADGLEVEDSTGTWRSIAAGPEQLVLLAGDCMSELSAGAIRPVRHRVALGLERYSVPYFQGLSVDTFIAEVGMRFGEHVAGRLVRSFPHLRMAHENGELLPTLNVLERNPFHASSDNPWHGVEPSL